MSVAGYCYKIRQFACGIFPASFWDYFKLFSNVIEKKVLFLMFYFPLVGKKFCLEFTIIFTNLFFTKNTKAKLLQLSAREACSYTLCDQHFVSVNIAAPEPARIIVILEDFAY